MPKNIAIVGGGDSSEYVISVKSAEQILQLINKDKYRAIPVTIRGMKWEAKLPDGSMLPVDARDFSISYGKEKIKFEYAFIIVHGTPGEDGKFQAYLDMLKIPYNTSNVLSSALTFNKFACKVYLKNFGITTAESVLISPNSKIGNEEIIAKVGLPCFVKPNNGGSSFGISKVTRAEDLEKALSLALKEDEEVIIESYVKGTELSCGLLKTSREEIIFPITEIVTANEFFDYEAKYTEGKAQEITPARVSEEITKQCKFLASEIYDHLNCMGIVRIDFIVRGNQIFFLELNSVPGMSKESIVPKQIRSMGLKVEDIIEKVIEDSFN
ncbi:MAG: D-alanine--D-alanine ligase [Bacteroidales bacterium]|nr:D-alanine--D-alanine ligase [Bacteroidales bacterium]MCB9013158.1 D-alanine--D-alanine ligase [Bacteroidales bacterium]